jgi:hypothetical protein
MVSLSHIAVAMKSQAGDVSTFFSTQHPPNTFKARRQSVGTLRRRYHTTLLEVIWIRKV